MTTIIYPDGPGSPQSPDSDSPADSVERFRDLRSGGRELALKLERFRGRDVVVLAVVLGGALVGHEVARALGATLDFVIIRKLLAPQGPGSLVCAANVAGTLVIDNEAPPQTAAPATPLDYFVADALDDLAKRSRACRGERPALELSRKTAILVDCGIRTSTTMRAAIRALRKTKPARIVAAVPVTSRGGQEAVAAIADELVFLASPLPFGHVGLWYTDFNRPGDDRISELLDGTE